jgi:hypothetical protein
VVLRAAVPRVVGYLVIVPHHHHWVLAVHELQIRIASVVRVAPAIVLEGHDLVRRIRGADLP